MIAHSSGPWIVRKNHGDHWGMREVIGASVRVTGFTVATDVDEAKAQRIEADCTLIAACPDMARALREMVRWFGNYPEYIPNPERSDEYEAAVKAARAALAKAGVTL
jgi:hypothetical protein